MDWWQAIAEWVIRPRVLHRLPGRLRVHLPFLKDACAADSPVLALVQRLLAVPDGIGAVRASPVTGNAVIEYDARRVTETEVLEFLKHALHLCLKHRGELATAGADGVLAASDKLEAFFRSTVHSRLTVDRNAEIPDDLLA